MDDKNTNVTKSHKVTACKPQKRSFFRRGGRVVI